MRVKSLQSHLPPCDPVDGSQPGSSVHEILQARILGWGAISSSRGISLTQGLNPHLLQLLYYRQILYCSATREALCEAYSSLFHFIHHGSSLLIPSSPHG